MAPSISTYRNGTTSAGTRPLGVAVDDVDAALRVADGHVR